AGEEIAGQPDLLIEITRRVEREDLAIGNQHADVRRGVEVSSRRLSGQTQRDVPADRPDPQARAVSAPAPGTPDFGAELRFVPTVLVGQHRDARPLRVELFERNGDMRRALRVDCERHVNGWGIGSGRQLKSRHEESGLDVLRIDNAAVERGAEYDWIRGR